MMATEDDAALALRGYVISKTGCLPTDPAFQELSRNEPLLQFTVHWLQKGESDLMDALMRLLGCVWHREDVVKMLKGETAAAPDRVFLPLAMGCNPQLGEQLKELFRLHKGKFIGAGEYQPSQGEQVIELGDLPVDEFKQWAQAATGAMGDAQRARQQSVTFGGEGKKNDPKLERIREQIAHSKRLR
jgi:hypothetical protein